MQHRINSFIGVNLTRIMSAIMMLSIPYFIKKNNITFYFIPPIHLKLF